MAQTSTERNQARRKRMQEAGMVRCEVYAPIEDHPAIKKYAKGLLQARTKKGKRND